VSAKKYVTRLRAFLQRQESSQNAPNLRVDRADGSIIVTIGDTDLPAFVSSGILYIQAPLPHIFKAFAQDLSDELRGMETRVSIEGRSALSLDGDGRPIYRAGMAFESMVPDSW
jgi:hypothetical protein